MSFDTSLEVQMLIEFLLKKKDQFGIIIPYADLEHEAGETIFRNPKGTRHLHSARQILRRRYSLNFLLDPGVGVYLADDETTARCGPRYQRKIRTQTKIFRLEQSCVKDWDKLSPEAKQRLDADRKAIGFIRLFTEDKTVKKIEEGGLRVPQITMEAAMKIFKD